MAISTSAEQHPPLTLAQAEQLLHDYEPVLRFSAGENFYPMRVDWYVDKSALCQHIPHHRDKTIFSEDASLEEKKNVLRSQDLVDHYLHFVLPYGRIYTLLMIVLIAVHAAVVGVAMLPQNIGILGPALHTQGELLKVLVLGLLLAFWPLGQANRKVHLALVLNLFGLFFFGTLPGLGFGLLVNAFMGSALALFFARGALLHLQNRKEEWIKVIISLLDAFFPVLVLGVSTLGAYLLMRFLGLIRLVSSVPISLPTRFGMVSLDPSLLGTGAVLGALLLIPGWFVLAKNLRPDRSEESRQIIVLACSALGIAALAGVGLTLGLFESEPGRAVMWIILLLISISAGFWLFTYPLDLVKGAPFLDPENRRAQQLGWNGNILFGLFFGSALWTIGSGLAYLRIFNAPGLFFLLNMGVTLLVLGASLANYILDLRSRQPDSAAVQAHRRYQGIIKEQGGTGKYWYYGRVQEQQGWVILHYMYFYAFNDWRSNAGGLNHHEGDWEAITVYLRRKSLPQDSSLHTGETSMPECIPYGVAYSQHHNGVFCFWDPPTELSELELGPEYRVVKKVQLRSPDGNGITTHPLVYVALGSHANYHWPDIYTTSAQFQGFMQDVLRSAERLLANFQPPSGVLEAEDTTNQFQKMGKAVGYLVQTAAQNIPGSQMVEEAISKATYLKEKTRDRLSSMFEQKTGYYAMQEPPTQPWTDNLTQDPPPGLPLEFAAGDGLRIGACHPDTLLQREFKWPARLPDHIRSHGTELWDGTCYEIVNGKKITIDWEDLYWQFEMVTDSTWWLTYKGLFGRLSGVKDEGGPTGPKWDRLDPEGQDLRRNNLSERIRLRWEGGKNGLGWLDTLLFDMVHNEDLALWTRKRALDALTHERKSE